MKIYNISETTYLQLISVTKPIALYSETKPNIYFVFFFRIPGKTGCSFAVQESKGTPYHSSTSTSNKHSNVILPGVYSLDCNYGPDRNKPNKRKWLDRKTKEKDVDHNQTASVSKLIIQRGHKVDCPAKICIKETYRLDCKYDVSYV